MPRAQWLELLCKHTPDRYEHLVRYVGWYSNRNRGARAKKEQSGVEFPPAAVEPMTEHALRAKAAWARLIRKVYEAGPREWPVMAADNGPSISVADATMLTAALVRHPTISAIDRRCQTQRYFRSCH